MSALQEAIQHLHQREPEMALMLLRPLAAQEPDDAAVQGYLSEAYRQLGQFPQALDAAQTYLRLRPGDPRGQQQLDRIRQAQGQPATPEPAPPTHLPTHPPTVDLTSPRTTSGPTASVRSASRWFLRIVGALIVGACAGLFYVSFLPRWTGFQSASEADARAASQPHRAPVSSPQPTPQPWSPTPTAARTPTPSSSMSVPSPATGQPPASGGWSESPSAVATPGTQSLPIPTPNNTGQPPVPFTQPTPSTPSPGQGPSPNDQAQPSPSPVQPTSAGGQATEQKGGTAGPGAMVACPAPGCGGSGLMVCPYCLMYDYGEACPMCKGKKRIPCWFCGGSGQVRMENGQPVSNQPDIPWDRVPENIRGEVKRRFEQGEWPNPNQIPGLGGKGR